MNKEQYVVMCLLVIGIGATGLGVSSRLGYTKGMYLFKGIPGLYPSGYIYASIPIGIWSLLMVVAILGFDQEAMGRLVGYGTLALMLLSITLMTWKPRWLKPWWLKWLEDHYEAGTLEYLLERARQSWKHGHPSPKNEAELKAWAEGVLGLPSDGG